MRLPTCGAETVGAPISPLDEVRVFRPGTEGEGAEGETGELAAGGPYTIRSYLDAPDRDREAFTAEGFYRSGDLVRARRYQGALSYSIERRVKNLIDAAVRRSTPRRSSSWSRVTPPLPRWPWSVCLIPDWASPAAPTSWSETRRTRRQGHHGQRSCPAACHQRARPLNPG